MSRLPVPEWLTFLIVVPPPRITTVCTHFEGYDNLALVRTRNIEQGLMEIYTAAPNRRTVECILLELERKFPLHRVGVQDGMVGIDVDVAGGVSH